MDEVCWSCTQRLVGALRERRRIGLVQVGERLVVAHAERAEPYEYAGPVTRVLTRLSSTAVV